MFFSFPCFSSPDDEISVVVCRVRIKIAITIFSPSLTRSPKNRIVKMPGFAVGIITKSGRHTVETTNGYYPIVQLLSPLMFNEQYSGLIRPYPG